MRRLSGPAVDPASSLGLQLMRSCLRAAIALLMSMVFVVAASLPADATWSVVGVDAETGEVGVAVASCVELGALSFDDGFELVALAPGYGAGISQAAYSPEARIEIQRLLELELSAEAVIAGVSSATFDDDFETRQHGVVVIGDRGAGFTGSDNSDFAGDAQGPNVAAQGNLLVSSAVIDDAIASFDDRDSSDDRSLAERLVDALEAGSLAGGDARCGDQTALFAHVSVIDENGNRARPNVVDLTTWVERGDGANPVTELTTLFRSGTTTVRPDPAAVPAPAVPLLLVATAAIVAALLCAAGVLVVRRIRRTRA